VNLLAQHGHAQALRKVVCEAWSEPQGVVAPTQLREAP
jgi:hypothetical protein